MPISAVAGAEIVTLEGLGTAEKPHPLQQAFIDEQAAQCGYCINGMIMQAAALLATTKRPTEEQVRQALGGQSVQMRHPRPYPARRDACCRADGLSRGARMPDTELSRRAFLQARRRARRDVRVRAAADSGRGARPTDKSVSPDEVGGFIAIDAKGLVTLYSGKVELGTGVLTAITQIAAEELSVPFESCDHDPGRYPADAEPGTDLRQPLDPERRHADPPRGGHRPRGTCSIRRRASSVLRKTCSRSTTA